MSVRVQQQAFDAGVELAAFTHPEAGASASFTGLVRGGAVNALILDHYPGFTEQEIARIEADARARFDVLDTLIIHRHGAMQPGEAIVLVAALSKHRKEALGCIDYLMDRLKTEAPFWKREVRADGEHWIEPRADDYDARAAWEQK